MRTKRGWRRAIPAVTAPAVRTTTATAFANEGEVLHVASPQAAAAVQNSLCEHVTRSRQQRSCLRAFLLRMTMLIPPLPPFVVSLCGRGIDRQAHQ